MWESLLWVCASKLDNFQKLAVSVDNQVLVRNLYTGLFWVRLPKWACKVRTGKISAEIARLESAQADLLGRPGSAVEKAVWKNRQITMLEPVLCEKQHCNTLWGHFLPTFCLPLFSYYSNLKIVVVDKGRPILLISDFFHLKSMT